MASTKIPRKRLPGLSITEVAKREGVHHSTVCGWIAGGLLKATRYGSGKRRGAILRIHRQDYAAFERPRRGRPPKRASA